MCKDLRRGAKPAHLGIFRPWNANFDCYRLRKTIERCRMHVLRTLCFSLPCGRPYGQTRCKERSSVGNKESTYGLLLLRRGLQPHASREKGGNSEGNSRYP